MSCRLKAAGILVLTGLALVCVLPVFIVAGIMDGIVEWWKFPSAVAELGRSLKFFD